MNGKSATAEYATRPQANINWGWIARHSAGRGHLAECDPGAGVRPSAPATMDSKRLFGGVGVIGVAVKSKRVYKVPLGGYRWDPPSQESPPDVAVAVSDLLPGG